jgi:tetratricopeptide (TPR) repeat protein
MSLFALLVVAALVACTQADPLEEILQRQQAGDLAGTVEPLRELLDERPGDAKIQFLYGRTLALTGQLSLAEWSLREAMSDPEYLIPAGSQLAYGALRGQNYPAAIETTTELLDAHPENVDVLVMRANAYAHSRMNHERALEDVATVLELAPDNVQIMEPKIIALLGLDRIDEAAEAIADLGKRIKESDAPDVAQMAAWHCSTEALFADESDEKELAEERWTDCLTRFPGSANVVSNALQFYDAKADFARTLEIARAAHAAKPDARDFRLSLAERLRASGDAAEATELLIAATKVDSRQLAAGAWYDLVKHHQALEDYEAAADAADRTTEIAREIGDPHPQLVFEQADALLIAGKLDRAEAVANEMTLPAHREMILARIAQERGDHAQALAHFDEAFRTWPDNSYARYYAALAAEVLGDFDRAADAYRYSIRIGPGDTDARVRVARQMRAEGHPVEALQLIGLKSNEAALDLAGELLITELFARVGKLEALNQRLQLFRYGRPQSFAEAAVGAANGVRERAGAEAAVRFLRSLESDGGLDFSDPQHSDALQALVGYAQSPAEREATRATVEAAVAANSDSAAILAIRGLFLEQEGTDPDQAREAYAAALALGPEDPLALLGSGRLAADPETALRSFDKAASADPDNPEPARRAAVALIGLGRFDEAESRLDALLEAHPHDAAGAARAAELHILQSAVTDKTLERAKRSARFSGGPDALELLARVHDLRGEAGLARGARGRVAAARERQKARVAVPESPEG